MAVTVNAGGKSLTPADLSKIEETLQDLRDRIQRPQSGQEVMTTGHEYHKVESFRSATVVREASDSEDEGEDEEGEEDEGEKADGAMAVLSTVNGQEDSVLQQVFGGCSIAKGVDGETKGQFGNISVEQSTGVHLGNVTYVLGNVTVRQEVKVVQQQAVSQQVFLSQDKGGEQQVFNSGKLKILRRLDWLAQPPMETPTPLKRPVPLVVICHTATEMGFSQAQNTFLVRSIQTYHIESKDWDDIAYNFLVGMDGHVYEGRGWEAVGAHTHGYNFTSIGVAFVGCFMRVLPSDAAIQAFHNLVARGVELGHISEDYKLCGHCQLRPIESPGKAFYNVIVEWPHWAPQP